MDPITRISQEEKDLLSLRIDHIHVAITRIMKGRKREKHNTVINDVIKGLENLFRPDPRMIKEQIEVLISKDIIARDPNDQ